MEIYLCQVSKVISRSPKRTHLSCNYCLHLVSASGSPSGSNPTPVPRSVPSTAGSVGRPSAVAATNRQHTQQQPQAHANQEYIYARPTAAINQITTGVDNLTINRNSNSSQSLQYLRSQVIVPNTSSMTHIAYYRRPLTPFRTIARAQTFQRLSSRGR